MQTKTEKRMFTILVTYFKANGKYYTDATFQREFRTVNDGKGVDMHDVTAYIRGERDSGGQEALPGLSGEGWDGFILVDCKQGYPCLILPSSSL